jgi:hypothetical protein
VFRALRNLVCRFAAFSAAPRAIIFGAEHGAETAVSPFLPKRSRAFGNIIVVRFFGFRFCARGGRCGQTPGSDGIDAFEKSPLRPASPSATPDTSPASPIDALSRISRLAGAENEVARRQKTKVREGRNRTIAGALARVATVRMHLRGYKRNGDSTVRVQEDGCRKAAAATSPRIRLLFPCTDEHACRGFSGEGPRIARN